jgi:NRAMP (natural resistance-associated macrophage protein)-like metal ion transporter
MPEDWAGEAMAARKTTRKTKQASQRFWQILGPGLITGASDDDPSGIGTYSQVGAQFGYGMTWVMLATYPLMSAIQEISARIGRVTGRGLAGNMRRHHSPTLLRTLMVSLLVANVINLGADLGAMGDAVKLLIGGPRFAYVVAFGALCVGLEIFMQYRRYCFYLKWSAVALFAYVATALSIHIPWGEVLLRTVVPHLQFDAKYLVAIVAVMGTTISPYLFFWQSSQEAEDERVNPDSKPLRLAPQQGPSEIRRIRIDTYIGMFFSNAIGWFIIVTVAATLNAHGITDIASSSQAAEALRPLAGPLAFTLFAAGIIGTGLLAIPVLAGSAAYAVAETLQWPVGLARLPMEAKAFYATIAVATLLGVAFNLLDFDPIKALFWSAVVNGVVAVPVMAVTMVMARQPRVMGRFTLAWPLTIVGWIATLAMTAVVIGMFATWNIC